MTISLTAFQCRVIGVMLEKETTTPEQYPLSLNALTNACNQKSNRDPVLSLSETQVQDVVDELVQMKQVSDQGAFGGRVAKYNHRFCNTEFGKLQLTEQQRALICVLLLRGAQTPGELRTRTNRLADFVNVTEVEEVLVQLQLLNDNKIVAKLPREPGKRESRFVHLFSDVEIPTEALFSHDEATAKSTATRVEQSDSLVSRITELEQQVAELKKQMSDLLAQLGS